MHSSSNPELRILFVIPSMSLRHGGPTTALRTMSRALAALGHSVTIVTTDDDGPDRSAPPIEESGEGVVYRVFRRDARFYKVSTSLVRWLRENVNRFDVVEVHALFSFTSVMAALLARRRGIPYVVHPLGTLNTWGLHQRRPLLKRLSLALFERRILDGAAAVHFTSEEERREAGDLVKEDRTIVIGHAAPQLQAGSRARFRQRYRLPSDELLVLHLGRIDRVKGLDVLIQAFASARTTVSARLLLVGSGETALLDELKNLAEGLGVSEAVSWVGHLDGEEKCDAFAAADVFAMPSRSENFGLAALEGMAAGLPAVISDRVPIHRAVVEAEAGFSVAPTVGEVADALRDLLEDEDLRRAMGHNAATLVATRFSREALGDQLEQLFLSVARDGRPPSALTQR